MTQEKCVTFDQFWEVYPRRIGKGQARAAWAKAITKAAPSVIVAAARQQSAHLTKDGMKFCPHPTTWLNGERWEDEIVLASTPSGKPALREAWKGEAGEVEL